MSLLRNRVVVITGSSSGIGRAIAIKCAQQGATLLLHHLGTSHSKNDVDSVFSEVRHITNNLGSLRVNRLGHTTFGADLTDEGAPQGLVDHAVSKFGKLDVMINNAGICNFLPALNVTKEVLQRHTDVNFTAAWLLTQAATRQMVSQYEATEPSEHRGSSVVTISSITARLGSSDLCHYAPSKAALMGMSTSFATAFGRYGIRYNCVLPGTTETAMNRDILNEDDTRVQLQSRVPLGRLGKPEDVAGAVVYLASEELAGYVSGQWILVDGGASVNYQQ
jgi:L-rhamnose 1-dehydrogenase